MNLHGLWHAVRDSPSTSAAHHPAARFHDDFESAVLHAILTGALVGAQVGLGKIPQRFLDGLEDSAEMLQLANSLAAQAGG